MTEEAIIWTYIAVSYVPGIFPAAMMATEESTVDWETGYTSSPRISAAVMWVFSPVVVGFMLGAAAILGPLWLIGRVLESIGKRMERANA